MIHVYGPVPSRRLGRSLGVDLIPPKTCNYSCIYCQLGRTLQFSNRRQSFYPKEAILLEIQKKLDQIGQEGINFITFVGQGEPTLSADLGWLIHEVKQRFPIKVAVITNGALLYDRSVQSDLLEVDVILPSLDAGTEEVFRRINRPHPSLQFDKVLEGMIAFRKRYEGEFWLEIMVVPGVNDGSEEIEAFKSLLNQIHPDRIYLNAAIRPPAESWVNIPSKQEINLFADQLGPTYDIVCHEEGQFVIGSRDTEGLLHELTEIIKRHPMREVQVLETLLHANVNNAMKIIEKLIASEEIIKIEYDSCIYLEWAKYRGIWN